MAEDLPVSGGVERQLHFVTSPSAADWPKGSRGSGREIPLPESIAVKPTLKFRFPEAATDHRVLSTLNCLMMFASSLAAF